MSSINAKDLIITITEEQFKLVQLIEYNNRMISALTEDLRGHEPGYRKDITFDLMRMHDTFDWKVAYTKAIQYHAALKQEYIARYQAASEYHFFEWNDVYHLFSLILDDFITEQENPNHNLTEFVTIEK